MPVLFNITSSSSTFLIISAFASYIRLTRLISQVWKFREKSASQSDIKYDAAQNFTDIQADNWNPWNCIRVFAINYPSYRECAAVSLPVVVDVFQNPRCRCSKRCSFWARSILPKRLYWENHHPCLQLSLPITSFSARPLYPWMRSRNLHSLYLFNLAFLHYWTQENCLV